MRLFDLLSLLVTPLLFALFAGFHLVVVTGVIYWTTHVYFRPGGTMLVDRSTNSNYSIGWFGLLDGETNSPNSVDLVIVSAFFLNNSKIYPPNTMVLLINARRAAPEDSLHLQCIGAGGVRRPLTVRQLYKTVPFCRWEEYIGTCEGMGAGFDGEERETEGRKFALIHSELTATDPKNLIWTHYERPYSGPEALGKRLTAGEKGVVVCTSPMYYFENWQLLLFRLEIYRHFGATLQVYYLWTAIAEILALLKTHEELYGAVAIEPWSPMQLDAESEKFIGYDPKYELSVNNQAGALTHCLIKYRNVAEFIFVSDMDDLLLPTLGSTYLEELRLLSELVPDAAAFLYPRLDTYFERVSNHADFSPARIINDAKITPIEQIGKSVVNASRVESVWFHWPGRQIPPGRGRLARVPARLGRVLHLHGMRQRASEGTKSNETLLVDRLGRENTDRIDQSFRARLSHAQYAEKLSQLPDNDRYLDAAASNYAAMSQFTSASDPAGQCLSPLKWNITSSAMDLRCVIAPMRRYSAKLVSSSLRVHVAAEEGSGKREAFTLRNDGCRWQ